MNRPAWAKTIEDGDWRSICAMQGKRPTYSQLLQDARRFAFVDRIVSELPPRSKPTGSGRKKGNKTEQLHLRLTKEEKTLVIEFVEGLRKK